MTKDGFKRSSGISASYGGDQGTEEEQERRIAEEVERASLALERELSMTFQLDAEHQKKFDSVSLYSDDEEGSDDESLEGGMESLRMLQSELNQVEKRSSVHSRYHGDDNDNNDDDDDDDDKEDDRNENVRNFVDNDPEEADALVHDQLPSVEEYKANQKISSKNNATSVATSLLRSFRRPDPPSSISFPSSYVNVSTSEQPNPGTDIHADRGSLLPSVEEYKTIARVQNRIPPSNVSQGVQKLTSSRCCVVMVILLLIIITFAVVLPAMFIAENKSRLEDVIKFISDNGLSTLDDLNNDGSPQNKAAVWIADEDVRSVKIADTHAFLDRYVMAVLFYSLGGDETWPDDLHFLSQAHICDWFKTYQTDAGTSAARGIDTCRQLDNGLVPISLSLSFHGLSGGKLPDEIRRLSHLETLILQFNPTLGGLPSSVLDLTALKTLSVRHCSLVGKIPDWLGNMTSLTSLSLGDNRLSGSVPESLFTLTDLQVLGLDDNFLKADLRRFGALTNLKSLYLDDNIIEGELTSAMLDGWENIIELDISDNLITSTIPGRIFSHKSLRTIDLHGNRLSGKIPNVLVEDNDALELLSLRENELGLSIPTSIAKLRGLQHLDLSQNSLTSTIPTEIETMQDLRYLFLGENNFERAPFPPTLYQLGNLKELSLSNSVISGTIPPSIGFLSSLVYLDLSGNSMDGTIPEVIGVLSNLRFLLLKENSFDGELPDQIGRLSNLEVLLVDGNNITGTADAICSQKAQYNVTYFASDCVREGTTNQSLPFECECCTVCCGETTTGCNDGFWSAMIDPTWETGYKRTTYDFGSEKLNIP